MCNYGIYVRFSLDQSHISYTLSSPGIFLVFNSYIILRPGKVDPLFLISAHID